MIPYLDIPARYEEHESQLRLNKLERRMENTDRQGEVSDLKYDKDLKRWFVRYKEETHGDPFTTDWVPWSTFSSGSIKVSAPPRKGQKVSLRSPGGYPEQGYCVPYHNGPDTPSPHDKEDEFFLRVEKPSSDGKPGNDKNKILDFKFTQDGSTVSIGDTTHSMSKDTISHKTKTNSVETDTDKTTSKSHSLETDSTTTTANTRTVTSKTTTIKSDTYALGGKVLINC